jgi:hypothetical protein
MLTTHYIYVYAMLSTHYIYMYAMLSTHYIYVYAMLSTQYFYVYAMFPTENSDLFRIYLPVYLCDGKRLCFLWDMNLTFKYKKKADLYHPCPFNVCTFIQALP